MDRSKVNMIKCSFSSILIAILLITLNFNNVKCYRTPIGMLFGHFQEYRAKVPAHVIEKQATGSQSEAQNSALTNTVNIAGIPITNTVSGGHASSTSGGHSGNLQEQFGVGGVGLNVGLASDKIGSGVSANRVPGQQLGLNIGALNLGLTNTGGGLFGNQNTQTQTSATAAATGQGAQSSSQSDTKSNSFSGLGGLFNVQNTLSNSQAQAYSQDGTTSANSGANGLATGQSAFIPNAMPSPAQSNFQHRGIGGIFNSFPINPFGDFNGLPFGSLIQPTQQYTQHQFGYQQFPGQQFANQQQVPFQQYPGPQYPVQQYPAHQCTAQPFPAQQFPNQQSISPFQGDFGPQNPSIIAPELNNNNKVPPTIQATIPQSQGLSSGFLDILEEKKNTANTPVPSSQIGVSGPSNQTPVLTQGGNQGISLMNPQQNISQNNVAENTIPTTGNSIDNKEAPTKVDYDLDVRISDGPDDSKNQQRSKRASSEDAVRFPEEEQEGAKSVSTSENKPATVANEKKAANDTELKSRFGFFGGYPGQQFNNFPQYQQQNANSNGFAQNQNPIFNQNTASNTYSQNNKNPFGEFQNTGGSSIGSNLANNGQSGQVSAANTDQQSYFTAQGFGQKNNGQSQSANFDQFGNLQTSNANTGTQFTQGPDGQRNQANGASNSHLQNQFGTSDSGSQTMSEDYVGPNGEKGSKSSASAFSSNVNNGRVYTDGNFGDVNNYNGSPQRFKRATSKDAVTFPAEEEEVAKSITASEHTPATVADEKEAANGTELESRFGLLGGRGRGRLGGIVRQVVGSLLGRQTQGHSNQGYYPQQGCHPQQGYYPEQGNIYNQEPGFYPQQGNYYNQGPAYYPQQPYPLQPDLGGPRFKRATKEAIVYPDDQGLNTIKPVPVETTKATINATAENTEEEKKENGTDVDSRFGFPGGIRNTNKDAIRQPYIQYGRRPSAPHFEGAPSSYKDSSIVFPTPDSDDDYHHHHHHHHHHGPPHHNHHHERPQIPSHNQPLAYPLQPVDTSNQPHRPSYEPQPQNNNNQQPNVNYPQQPYNQQTNTNGASQSQNQNPHSNQNSASNTHSSNVNNAQGNFQNTGGSSISSNIANNGQSGQVSSSNTEQQSSQTAHGLQEKNTGQSQSANFDQNGNLGTSSANTGTQHTIGPDGERNQATGAANSHQQTQYGVSDSNSQTLSETFNQNGVVGNKATGQSTSNIQGADGSVSTSSSGSETQTFEGPNGIKGTSSSSHSSSLNIGNSGNVGTSSSSGSGTGFGGSQAFSNTGAHNANPYGGGSGAQTNAFSGSNNYGSNAGANAGSNTHNFNLIHHVFP